MIVIAIILLLLLLAAFYLVINIFLGILQENVCNNCPLKEKCDAEDQGTVPPCQRNCDDFNHPTTLI